MLIRKKHFIIICCFLTASFLLYIISKSYAEDISIEEKEYLQKKSNIIFVSHTRYPPFEFVDIDQQHEGMMLDIVRWIAVEMGFKPIFTNMSFQQAQEAVISGKADVITSLFFSEKRKERFQFTSILFEVPASIFVKAIRTDIKEINDLHNKTIAIQKGDYAKEFLESKNIRFKIFDTKDFNEATDMVVAGKADAVIGDEQIVLYHVFDKKITEQIKKVGESLYIGKNCMASSKSNKILISILNKGIVKAQKAGILDKVGKKWLGTMYGKQESLIDQYMLPLSLIIGGLFLIAVWVWILNARLRTLIQVKTEDLKFREHALRESEEKYRLVVENAWEAIIITQEEKIKFVNHIGIELIGHSEEKIYTRPFTDFIHPDDRMMVIDRHIRRLKGENITQRYTFRIVSRGDIVKLVEINSILITWKGNPATLNFLSDITERKKSEEALRDSEEKYRTLYNNIPDIIYSLDKSGNIITVNQTAFSRYGYEPEMIIGKPFIIFVHPEDIEKIVNSFHSAIQNNREYTRGLQFRILSKNAIDSYWVELNSHMRFDKEGVFLQEEGILRDITDRKKEEQERKNLESQLIQAQKLEAIGTLAGGIAHDFNNLLMGIQGYCSLMLLEISSDHPHYVKLRSIEEQVKSGAELTRQLLGFARSGKYESRPVNLNEIIDKTADMFGRTKKDIIIRKKLGDDLWTIEADRGQIEQVLLNLYVNAWQAMPSGGDLYLETKNIILNNRQVIPYGLNPGGFVQLSVTDTGIGMDQQTIGRIFDPFFTTKEKGRGSGLGLASVYGILRNHGGFIEVFSEKDKGATFNIYIPGSGKSVEKPNSEIPDLIRGSETIILVDDEKAILDITGENLTALGYKILKASSGQEAVDIYQKHKDDIQLIILDMIMPGLSGGETFDFLRKINSNVKVILCSGYSIDGEAQKILDRGCKGFIQKPFNLYDLSQKIRNVL